MKTIQLLLGATLLSCSTMGNMYAQKQITACNGKTYTIGDTLRIGKSDNSGYLFVRQLQNNGELSFLRNNLHGLELIIKDIPAYSQKLYEDMVIYEKPEKPAIVKAEGQQGTYYIYLDQALVHGDIMSTYKQSVVEGYKELTPAALFVYCMKQYNKPIDNQAIETYASLIDQEAYQSATQDPFEMEELRSSYKEKLQQAIADADFSQVFRLKCVSEAGEYNIEKNTLALDGFYPIDVRTSQKDELAKLHYCLWGKCAFHFTNSAEFSSINCHKADAKSMYNLKKYKGNTYDKSIILTSYVYVRIQNKPVQLPSTRVTVVKPGKSFDFDITTLDKAYGTKSLLMDIVHVDSYQNIAATNSEGDLDYNYVGGKSKLAK